MCVDATPPLDEHERRALLTALNEAAVRSAADPYEQPWRVAALREGVDGEEDAGYAFSPRSTRGATRA